MKKQWKTPELTVFGSIEMTEQRILTGNWPKSGCYRWADPASGPSFIKDCGTGDAVNQSTGALAILGS